MCGISPPPGFFPTKIQKGKTRLDHLHFHCLVAMGLRALRALPLTLRLRSMQPRFFSASQTLSYALWNPFKRAPTVDTQKDDDKVPIELVDLIQQVRKSDGTRELAGILRSLAELPQSKQSFSLMSDVIKKLDMTPSEGIISGVSPEDALRIYTSVTSGITRENYQSARFIPRLYLQLMKQGELEQDPQLTTLVFEHFVQYLITLGFEDQLLKVVKGFSEQSLTSKQQIVKSLIWLLDGSSVHPSLIIGLVTVLPDDQLLVKSVDQIVHFLKSRNVLFAMDPKDQDGITCIIDLLLSAEDPEMIYKALSIFELIDFPAKEKQALEILQSKEITSYNQGLLITRRALASGCAPLDAQLWLNKMKKFPLLQLTWETALNPNQPIPKELLSEVTLNLMVLATVNSHPEHMPQVMETFAQELIEPNVETFEILLNKYISTKEYNKLEQAFDDSLKHGIDWSGNATLYKFFVTLASSPDADVKHMFQLSKRIKIHLPYLDADSYSCLLKLILQSEFIEDAVVSFDKELPPLEDDTKFTENNYPSLHTTILMWCIDSAIYPEDVHRLYKAFSGKFIIPASFYFPLIKRLTELHRPDLAFETFQDMKRLHRTTGSIPPPPPDVYIHLFKSFGHELYSDGVETLDAIYKTDLTINSSVPLLNSILDAYTSLQNFNKVSQTYQKILRHPHGPDNETVSIMLKAQSLLSLDNVKNYWNDLDQIGVLPDKANYERYLIGHCYHGESRTALEIASSMEEMDVTIDKDIIKTLYDWSESKELVEDWAKSDHPEIWNQLEKKVKSLVKVEEGYLEPGMTAQELKLIRM